MRLTVLWRKPQTGNSRRTGVLAVSVALAVGGLAVVRAAEYDRSWMTAYTWTEKTDQTVTETPTVPTLYRGATTYNTNVSGQPVVFSGGSVNFPTGRILNQKLTTGRIAFLDAPAVTFNGWQTCAGDGMIIDFVGGTASGSGLRLGSGKKDVDYSQALNIYDGTWTAQVAAYNSANCTIDMTGPKVNVYGGTFAPPALGPMNGGTMTRHITVHLAGGTFVVPKMTTGSALNTTVWFEGDAGTESIMKLGVDVVKFKGVTTLAEGSVVRLQSGDDAEDVREFVVCSNFVGKGELRIERATVDLSAADCIGFTGVLTCKGGSLRLGAAKAFGDGAKIRIDVSDGNSPRQPVVWTSGAAPTGVTYELDEVGAAQGIKLVTKENGIFLAREITSSMDLESDLDLRSFGIIVELAPGVTIDLKGHDLFLSGCVCATVGGAAITDTTGGGTLHMDVAEGEVVNESVRFTGSLKLVKEGDGMFVPNLTGQDYTGGTEICAGTVRANSSMYASGSGKHVIVRSGGTLNINGRASYSTEYVLDGGTLENIGMGNSVSTNSACIASLTLTDDSFANAAANFGLIGYSLGKTMLDLGGHKLSLSIASGAYFYLCNSLVTNGTFEVTSGGYLKIDNRKSPPTPLNGRTADFILKCAVRANVDAEVHDYVNNFAGNYGEGTGVFRVFGTFRPNADYFAPCELQDGATIDLSKKMGAWSTKSLVTQGGIDRYVRFADGATVTVDLSGRTDLESGMKILSWDESSRPHRVRFIPDAESAGRKIVISSRHDGAYLNLGFMLIVR